MLWLKVLVILAVLAGVAFVWHKVYSDRDVVGCIGCGKCLETGECVMVKHRRRKPAAKGVEPSSKKL